MREGKRKGGKGEECGEEGKRKGEGGGEGIRRLEEV